MSRFGHFRPPRQNFVSLWIATALKGRVSRSGAESAYVLPVTAVSISRTSAPPTVNTDTQARSDSAHNSAFKSQLRDAIQDCKGEAKGAGQDDNSIDGDTPEHGKKKADGSQQPVIAAVMAATLPTPPAAGLGLPTDGIEPGPSGGTPTAASDGVPQETPATLQASGKPAASPEPDLKADLAFALRLLDLTPSRMSAESNALLAPEESSPPTSPTPAAQSAASGLIQSSDVSVLTSSGVRQGLGTQPIKATTQAAPVNASLGQPSNTSPHSSQPGHGSDASEKEPVKDPPKVERPREAGQAAPEVELKPARGAGVASSDMNSAHRETPLQNAGMKEVDLNLIYARLWKFCYTPNSRLACQASRLS